MGIEALATNHNFKPGDYPLIARECDFRTIVGIARTEHPDTRFFLPPRIPELTEEHIGDILRKLLASMPTGGLHKCTKYFTSSALEDQRDPGQERGGLWCFGGADLAFAESITAVPEEQVVLFCLQALVRHSKIGHHCHVIVECNCLDILKFIHKNQGQNISILRNICRILANLATDESLHSHVVTSGWLTTLKQWISSPDIELSLTATKALANLDIDVRHRKYQDGVYLVHPLYRFTDPIYADVIFVHGLQGGPFVLWKQRVSNLTGRCLRIQHPAGQETG